MKNPIPTRTQITEVRRLLATDLFNLPTVVRWTGVPIRDVFRIARSLGSVNSEPPRQFSPIVVTPDGKVLSGVHQFSLAEAGK